MFESLLYSSINLDSLFLVERQDEGKVEFLFCGNSNIHNDQVKIIVRSRDILIDYYKDGYNSKEYGITHN